MTRMSFTLCGVDVTIAVPGGAVWWSCADCGAEVELPHCETEPDVTRFLLSCPDCPASLLELWRWEPVTA